MRLILCNSEQVRSKAKFLQKCLVRFGVERSLTQCQSYLAAALGFSNWSEMLRVLPERSPALASYDPIGFHQMARSKFDEVRHTNLVGIAIFTRMGFCPSVHHFDYRFEGFQPELCDLTEIATALEMVFERYLEIEQEGPEVDGLIAMSQAMIAPYLDVHPGAFELNASMIIDQMKALRIPGMCPASSYSGEATGKWFSSLEPSGVFTFENSSSYDGRAEAMAIIRQIRRHSKVVMPLRWLLDKKLAPKAGEVGFVPAVTEGSRAFITTFECSNRIFVVNNAPKEAAIIPVSEFRKQPLKSTHVDE